MKIFYSHIYLRLKTFGAFVVLLLSCAVVTNFSGCTTYGPYEKEAEQLTIQLENNPDDYAALVKMGKINYRLKRYDDALEYFHRAEALKPNTIEIYFAIGLCMLERGQYEEVLRYAVASEKKSKPDARFYYLYGAGHYGMGDYSRAFLSFQKGVEMQPDHAPSLYGLGKTYAAMGKNQEALAVYNRLRIVNPALAEKLFMEL